MKYFNLAGNKTLFEATDDELYEELNRREQKKIMERSKNESYSTKKAPGIMKPNW